MSNTAMNIVIKAQDKASAVLDRVGVKGENAGKKMEQYINRGAYAISAAGVAIEGLARKQQGYTEQTNRLAASLDMTEKEVRKFTTSLSDVTLPYSDVLDLMEVGRQRGLETQEQLEDFITTWDMVGDASGESATKLAQASNALQAFNIDDPNEAMSAFGYILQETTQDIGDFMRFTERNNREIQQLGVSVDETAAIMGILEQELGMSGQVARQEFRQAVSQSNGELDIFMDQLGISNGMLDEYTGKVGESSEVIERNAEIHADSYTILQRAQAAVSDLTYRYGDHIQTLSNVSMIMTSMGPIVQATTAGHISLAAAQNAGSVAARVFGAAIRFALGPVGLIITAIGALIAIIKLLYNNWDEVTSFMSSAWEAVMNGVNWYIDMAKDRFDMLINGLKTAWTGFGNFFKTLWEGFTTVVTSPINFILNGVNKMIDGLNSVNIKVPNWVPGFGGNQFGLNIPNIPTLHSGTPGRFVSGSPDRQGLAMLKDGERVTSAQETKRQDRKENNESGTANIFLQIDGRTFAKVMGVHLKDEVIARTGRA